MLQRLALLAISAPRRILAGAILVAVAAGIFGLPVANSLSASGFADPTAESSRATELLTQKFGQGDVQMLITVTAQNEVLDGPARAVGLDVVDRLQRSPHVANVTSAWTAAPGAATELVSRDGKAGLIVAGIRGSENDALGYAKTLADEVTGSRDGVTVRAGGVAMVNVQITEQSQRDLLLMESLAIPFSFLVLVWVFGGLLAAALPVAVGVIAILGSLSVLRLITLGTDVSIFALNLTTAMGLALAIDYTLLIISRFRDELADGADRDTALVRTMVTAGRTVLFSATTVALSMAVMVLFPMHFLKSFAYGGVATVAFAAAAAVIVAPAAIVLLGDRLNSLDVRRLARRVFRRPDPVRRPIELGAPPACGGQFWYRSTKFVMARTLPIGLAVIALLLLLGAPFLGVRWGFPDDRVLPGSLSAHQVGDQLRNDFVNNSETEVTVVIPDAHGLAPADLDGYAAALSRVPDVMQVSAPGGTYVHGDKVGPPAAGTGVAGPAGRAVEMTGTAQINHDSVDAITERLPLVLGLIAVITFVLLFLLTGSVALPLKALVCNVLSLTAAFGAMVWIFQDGHLGALGTTSTGTLVANMPVLLFCIAFGLSMDYEVFLISRIREYWLASEQTDADNSESVALGLARTGRVVTAAALIMSISFAALIAAQVQVMRLFGLGLTVAVLVDATLVRMVLVPAFMQVLGRWNWWAPKPLARLHDRIGLTES
ncbi:MAG TPA: MMPL family transporter [Mycobacterium sp.]